jgi:hypothetical protein
MVKEIALKELILAALTFVLALAWRDLFKDLLNAVIPQEKIKSKLLSELVYAIAASAIVIALFYFIA